MRVTTFKNGRGLIHGSDAKRIGCDKEGVLRIGGAEISISPDADAVFPVLFNGCTGVYDATFTDKDGNIYDLEKVEVRGGRIVPPSETAVSLMEIRSRLDLLEDECVSLLRKINVLSNIFDTDSLNFLIK